MVRKPLPRILAMLALFLAGSAAASPAPEEPAVRVAFIGPLSGPLAPSGEESLLGLRMAAETSIGGPPLEILPLDDGDDPKAAVERLAEALKKKCSAVVCAAPGVNVHAVPARARPSRTPVLFVGTAPPRATPDLADPVLFVGPWPVEQAMEMTGLLALRSEKEALGLNRECFEPAVVAEDTPRGREMAEAIARNVGQRQALRERVLFVPPHGAPDGAALAKFRAGRCDRLLLVGEPDLVDATAAALKGMAWEVPLLCADGMLSRAAKSLHDGTVRRGNFLYGGAMKVLPAGVLAADVARAAEGRLGKGSAVYTRTVNGFFAGRLLQYALASGPKPAAGGLVGALRTIHYGDEERLRPYFDDAGRAALYQWAPWTQGEKGPAAVNPLYLPTTDLGPPLRMKRASDWDAVAIGEDTRVVWLTFGEEKPKVKSDPARTIEEDLAALGLSTRGYEADLDPWLLEELQCRTLGKINRLFLKNYDGTFVPGVSYDIHFTFTKPEHLKPSRYWVGIIAGEETPDSPNAPGGKVIGSGRVAIYSRWMREYIPALGKANRLYPKMSREDKPYLDGSYAWGTSLEQNLRSGRIRALVDGYSSFFSMTGAHEFGHVCGCGHDVVSSRSIMNVVDAVGLRDTQATWIPDHVRALETALGRWTGR